MIIARPRSSHRVPTPTTLNIGQVGEHWHPCRYRLFAVSAHRVGMTTSLHTTLEDHRHHWRCKGRAAVAVMALASLVAVAAPRTVADAQGTASSLVTRATSLRNCNDTRCSPLMNLAPGTWVTTLCWRDGGWDASTNRWFRVQVGATVGWVNLSYVGTQAAVSYCADLRPNESLFANQSVWSSNGRYVLVMQSDGNLVEYGPSGAMWASATQGANWAVMQGDGNLVVYRTSGGAVWNTGTGFAGTSLAVQDDGNVVEYAPAYGAVWAASWHEGHGRRSGANAAAADPSQCTYYALEMWKAFTAQHNYPAFKYGANAGGWVQAIDGWAAAQIPMTQALVVWPGQPGHVAWVLGLAPNGRGGYSMYVTERNYDWHGSTRSIWMPVSSGLWFIPAPAL